MAAETVDDCADGPGCFENSLEIKRPELCAEERAGLKNSTKVKPPDISTEKRNWKGQGVHVDNCPDGKVTLNKVAKILLPF